MVTAKKQDTNGKLEKVSTARRRVQGADRCSRIRETRYDGKDLRRVLISMITNDEVLSRITSVWPKSEFGGLFRDNQANLIGGWCVTNYRKHNKAPNETIILIFEEWADKRKEDDPTRELVSKLLETLNAEYDLRDLDQHHVFDSAYLLDFCEKFFNHEQRLKIADAIRQKARDVDQQLRDYQPIELTGAAGLTCAAEITSQQVNWLWNDWIPQGELSIIDGDPGCGKSQLTIDLAARISRGWLMPPCARKPYHRKQQDPANVILLSTEDASDTVIRPRLDALGADVCRIWMRGTDSDLLTLPTALPQLEKYIKDYDAKLVVLDPFYGFVGGKVDANIDHKIRSTVLAPLTSIAQQTGAAIVLIRHLNKKSDEPVLYRGGGSIGILAACRSAIVIGRDPENPETRVMAINKASLARPPSSLAFEIESVANELGGTSRIDWIGEVDLEAADVVRHKKQPQGRPSKIDEVAEYMSVILNDGPMPAVKLKKMVMDKFEISERTHNTARKQAGVKSRQEGFQGKRMVFLP